jgi:hypothetical protein
MGVSPLQGDPGQGRALPDGRASTSVGDANPAGCQGGRRTTAGPFPAEAGWPQGSWSCQRSSARRRFGQALKEDRFDRLPAPAYAKGFLRTYADYLGLDAQRFVDEYNAHFAPAEEPQAVGTVMGDALDGDWTVVDRRLGRVWLLLV